MNNVMRHKFTLRETILLIVLIAVLFIGLYFLLVFYPIRNRTEELNESIATAQQNNTVADIMLARYNRMEDAVKEIEQMPEDQRTYMHKHTADEEGALLESLGNILQTANSYTSGFTSRKNSDTGVWERSVRFTFGIAASTDPETAYSKCKTILYNLLHTDNRRCLITDLNLSPREGNLVTDEITVSGTIVFYEID